MSIWGRPPGGFTPQQTKERRRRRIQGQLALVAVVLLSVGAVGGYRWVTTVRPVDRSQAVELFRAARSGPVADETDRTLQRKVASPGADVAARSAGALSDGPRSSRSSRSRSPVAADGPARPSVVSPSEPTRKPSRGESRATAPDEGVYSWETEGYEQVGGARREFPDETQRIITLDENETWTQHHYFSEDRQIWTAFQRGPSGAEITRQRNKVTFGPVTNESEIEFSPAMLAAPSTLETGFEWEGNWDGDTYGSYSGEVLERSTMEIGGQQVEVWEMAFVISLRGDQEGRVEARVWFAPGPVLTVREHYVQDVRSSGASYHAEWMQTLKSLEPRQ
jgi:hypothetical protein